MTVIEAMEQMASVRRPGLREKAQSQAVQEAESGARKAQRVDSEQKSQLSKEVRWISAGKGPLRCVH